ncbi:hypothetical protein [Halegenticoccus tardaugens]|uniref:hypothetical protein n=1 Tax=Halegenticoccus tardaugens TaxID=2071624 RepID=UPI00100AFB29|nr:hypothetical protein [Halegenticoccus tardaugens]
MYELVAELFAELLAVGFFAVGAGALTTVGLYFERLSLEALAAGRFSFALWIGGMGALALYFGPYLMGYTELLPRLRSLLETRTA